MSFAGVSPAGMPSARVIAARNSVFVIFTLSGVAFSSWASRIADAKGALNLSASQLGVTLFAMSLGSIIAMPLTGRLAEWLGAVRTVRSGMVSVLIGFVTTGIAVDQLQSRAVLAGGLFFIGTGIGVWDVAMNLEGASVERLLGRTVMPQFHAAFSGGTVISALIGAGMSWGGVPLLVHLVSAGVLVLAIGLVALRSFLPRALEDESAAQGEQAAYPAGSDAASSAPRARSAWLEPRTVLIGLVTFVAAFTEGTANDWLAVAFVEGHHLPAWAGVLAFATFLTFMTAGRLVGARMLDAHGRVPVLRITFALAVVGSLMVVFGPAWMAYAGAAIWGVGVSLGFPVGMSASADDPGRAGARMSVVATVGYFAFIAGPPALGFLGDRVGVLHSLLVVGAMALLVQLILDSVREPNRSTAREAAEPTP